MAEDVHLPLLRYRCHSAAGSAKVGSLMTRVEQATGQENPAAALISFASRLTGRQAGPQSQRRAATPRSQSRRRGRDDTGVATSAAERVTAWDEIESDDLLSGKRSPDASIILSRPGSTPIWTPQPGSRTYSRMAQAYKDARARVENVPSVRAYPAVLKEGETPKPHVEELKLPRQRVHTPPMFHRQSFSEPGSDHLQFNDHVEVTSLLVYEPSETEDVYDVPWSEQELRAVFRKFSDVEEREIRTEELYSLLRYLGARPMEDEVRDLVRKQTWYASLDWFEFIEFIKRFREHDLEQLRVQFANADEDGNGTLDSEEITHLLLHCGYAPTQEAVTEAMHVVDVDGSGTVCFSEFEMLREHLRSTRGFLKTEAEEMRRLFMRISHGQEKLVADEIWRISSYIGYQMTQQEIYKIVKEVDRDGSNAITFDELLEIVRAIREGEKDKLMKVIAQFAMETSCKGKNTAVGRKLGGLKKKRFSCKSAGDRRSSLAARRNSRKSAKVLMPKLLNIDDIGTALTLLGYFVSPEIIVEILDHQLREHQEPEHLTAEELMSFLDVYRQSEGFTRGELEDLRRIFEQEQRSSIAGCNDDALDALELGRVLRGFGISRTLQQVQRLIEDIDLDASGEVEFYEFTKLMRQIFQEECKQRRAIFDGLDTAGRGVILTDQVEVALRMITDVVPDTQMIETAMSRSVGKMEMMGVYDFERFFGQYRRCLTASVQEHAGFVPSEVEILREIFNGYDKDHSGSLEASELRNLIGAYMPETQQSVQNKLDMQRLVQEVAPGAETKVFFKDFLWLIRKCHDMRDERDIVQEVEVVRSCNYTTEEVEGLRQLFSSHIDWAGELSLDAMVDILKGIVDITEKDCEELELMLQEINPGKRAVARFPQFLTMMRRLTDENLFGVNEAADRTLLRQELRRSRARSLASSSRRAGMLQARLKTGDKRFSVVAHDMKAAHAVAVPSIEKGNPATAPGPRQSDWKLRRATSYHEREREAKKKQYGL